MPVGYWLTVAIMSWGVACALNRWRRPGSFSAIPALLVSELPFIVAYLLIASTVLALAEGDLDSPGGAVGAAVALLALVGLVVVVRRELRAPSWSTYARCRATRLSTPSYPVHTMTSTCSSPSGPPRSARQSNNSPRRSADRGDQVSRLTVGFGYGSQGRDAHNPGRVRCLP